MLAARTVGLWERTNADEKTGKHRGARRPAQLEETAGAADWSLDKEDIEEIETLLTEREKKLARN
jgi:aryl-alcohol dehydrogenase-like predicted oxidoreductase